MTSKIKLHSINTTGEDQVAKLREELAKQRPFMEYWNPVKTLLDEHFGDVRNSIYKITYSTLSKRPSVSIIYGRVDSLTKYKLDQVISGLKPLLNAVGMDIQCGGYLK